MTTAVRDILQSFERLAEVDRRELATEIMRRCLRLEFPPLSNEDLMANAEDLFLELDRREEKDARAQKG